MSLPHFTGEEGICLQLEQRVGQVEGGNRWETFLLAGSRTAVEFERSWSTLRQEAEQCYAYLGKQPEGELASTAATAGSDRSDGSTRRLEVFSQGFSNLFCFLSVSVFQD